MLEDMIRDCLVCGINDGAIQKRLLVELTLTYTKAVELTLSAEAAAQSMRESRARPAGDIPTQLTAQQVHKTSGPSPFPGPAKTLPTYMLPLRPQWTCGSQLQGGQRCCVSLVWQASTCSCALAGTGWPYSSTCKPVACSACRMFVEKEEEQSSDDTTLCHVKLCGVATAQPTLSLWR